MTQNVGLSKTNAALPHGKSKEGSTEEVFSRNKNGGPEKKLGVEVLRKKGSVVQIRGETKKGGRKKSRT